MSFMGEATGGKHSVRFAPIFYCAAKLKSTSAIALASQSGIKVCNDYYYQRDAVQRSAEFDMAT